MSEDRSRAAAVLEGLDPQQRAVATAFGAPVVVLAGAGTGKTRAITHRIAYGALTGHLAARHTLAVTFTTKAAGELRHRLRGLGVPGVQARTFHSAARRQIVHFWPRVNGHELPPISASRFSMIADALRGMHLDVSTPLLRELAGEIGWAKASNVAVERYPQRAVTARRSVSGMEPDQVAQVMERYEHVKRRREVIDFDDILLCAVALLHEHPEVAAQIRDQYRHFTVDEFQDVSPVQRTLLELWLGGRDDVCVVGDLNQAIHTFAGAQPLYLNNFAKDHASAIQLKLETNYRSTPQVLNAANSLIGRGLKLRPTREPGPRIEVSAAADEQTEAAEVVAWLVNQHEAGLAWQELAVLYRINAQAETIRAEMDAAKVPYQIRDAELTTGERPDTPDGDTDAVTLTTMHSAKGLEWEAVAIIGLSDGLMPFGLADTPAALAEERRLLYVALTRARTWLRLSWAAGGASGRGHRVASRYLRRAGLTDSLASDSPAARAKASRRGRSARTLPDCHVCGQALSEAAEIKLGRHHGCPAHFDEGLFDALRDWRLQEAQSQSMPAFVVFTDATLRALAEQRPGDESALLRIPGIGASKMARYGQAVLQVIGDHAAP